MRLIEYKDKVYGVNYCFIFDVITVDKIPNFLKKKSRKIYKWYIELNEESKQGDNFSGKTIKSGNNIMILIKKDKDKNWIISSLVHECLHAMFLVFGDRGVEIQDGGNNEHATYYLDHLVLEALK